MNIPVKHEGIEKYARCEFVRFWDRRLLARWDIVLSFSPQQQDSIEFLESSLSKWRLYENRGRVAKSVKELAQLIRGNAKVDALGVIALSADWWDRDDVLGFCQFRRTWSHNLAIDYLAVHPVLLEAPRPVSGVGTALLYRLATIAHEIVANQIWLEASDLSVNYYAHLFGMKPESDVIIIPRQYFYEALRSKFT